MFEFFVIIIIEHLSAILSVYMKVIADTASKCGKSWYPSKSVNDRNDANVSLNSLLIILQFITVKRIITYM